MIALRFSDRAILKIRLSSRRYSKDPCTALDTASFRDQLNDLSVAGNIRSIRIRSLLVFFAGFTLIFLGLSILALANTGVITIAAIHQVIIWNTWNGFTDFKIPQIFQNREGDSSPSPSFM